MEYYAGILFLTTNRVGDFDEAFTSRIHVSLTRHGDYAWYHKKFRHEDATLTCACGKEKAPSHLVHCPRARRRFASWPQRPSWPPTNAREGLKYLQQLLSC